MTVPFEEKDGGHCRNSLIAVDERMILDQAESVCRSESYQIRLFVRVSLTRARKRRLEQAFAAKPLSATVLDEQPTMKRKHKLFAKPQRFGHGCRYLASERNALR